MFRWTTVGAPALLLVVGIGGCGGDGNPRTEPVSGTVTLDGDLVEGAVVSFSSETGGQSAVGTTDASGQYELTTFQHGDGATEGTYRVSVAKWDRDEPPSTAAPLGESQEHGEGDYRGPEDSSRPAVSKNLLPDRYNNPQTSGLTYTVTQGENTYDIALTR